MAIRSLLETVACQQIIVRRGLLADVETVRQTYGHAQTLAAKLHVMRRAVTSERARIREDLVGYTADGELWTEDERLWTTEQR